MVIKRERANDERRQKDKRKDYLLSFFSCQFPFGSIFYFQYSFQCFFSQQLKYMEYTDAAMTVTPMNMAK